MGTCAVRGVECRLELVVQSFHVAVAVRVKGLEGWFGFERRVVEELLAGRQL
jgi:hypothetical protein